MMKSMNKVGYKTEPCGTPQLIEKDDEVAPSTAADIKRLERKLEISEQRGGGNQKEGSLESNGACHTLSKGLDISSTTTQYSP